MSSKMILAATSQDKQVYFIVNSKKNEDGVIISNDGSIRHVMFIPYMNRNGEDFSPVLTNDFLQNLWNGNKINQEKWNNQFISRTEKFTDEEIEPIKPILIDVPEEKNPQPAEAINFDQQINQKKKTEFASETKSRMRLPSFGKPAKAVRSAESVIDRDNDGRVGDGTPEERPAPPRIIRDIFNHIMVHRPGDTKKALTDREGRWNPERVQLHNAIATMFRRRGKRSENPTVYFLGGGPASRKSSALKAGLPNFPEEGQAVNADADQIKELIPEYKSWKKTDKHAASHVHGESKHIHSVVTEGLLEDQSDIIYDTTGDGDYANFKKRVKSLRKHGHKIVAHYMTNDVELAKQLNEERYKKTGRKVPTHQLEYIHGQVSRVVPQALKDDLFDEFYLYDTNNLTKAPRLIASKKRGEPLQVHDKYAYKRFLKKGIPPKPPKSKSTGAKPKTDDFKIPSLFGKPKSKPPKLPIAKTDAKKSKR